MENFVIAKAIGFVLAGFLIALFNRRNALFWGGTLVVSAFIGYANPIWGFVTFLEILVGWLVGRQLLKKYVRYKAQSKSTPSLTHINNPSKANKSPWSND